jgi:hypothetical protein
MPAAGLQALLTGIVDYAGLFPPAQLPLDEAIRNYARYCTQPESWMLGRFICPASRLAELSPYVDKLFRDGPTLAISALGRGGKDAAEFRDGLRDDVNDVADFRRKHRGRVTVGVLETRLPAGVPGEELIVIFASAGRLLDAGGPTGVVPYFEVSTPEDWAKAAASLVAARMSLRQNGPVGGLKLRCGGAEASAFPSADTVALAIVLARGAEAPLKFTAGLHHPIRHYDSSIGMTSHGFLNVFVAGVLANARGLDGAGIREIIEEEEAESFAFSDDGLRWRHHTANLTEIAFARRSAATSFGSCSFDEPRDDLRALALL